ncbi:hypothetical protein CEUSTIGMA_g8559.t1 [Chlamydomonas eustigma]|uniref:CL1 n=1 Tax=Chlamydomonas eustigma TaxID=1157962 RepID=A0A250XDG3_9CHLO|nr:hypothetical protein CEUSTIGMA_g8559.t1 [Chlamydomonas eustigma]|eukprot:GAX81125.1 hypothetical protein CEUSTIGMA_g8559.t1 [Chlamydomonas eustigma]
MQKCFAYSQSVNTLLTLSCLQGPQSVEHHFCVHVKSVANAAPAPSEHVQAASSSQAQPGSNYGELTPRKKWGRWQAEQPKFQHKTRKETPEAGPVVNTTAPWPFVDPTRPMILPIFVPVSQRRREPIGLREALQEMRSNAVSRISGGAINLSGRQKDRQVLDESVELIVNLGVNPRKADQVIRGAVDLPHGTGKKSIICVFAKGAEAEAARAAGADVIGDEALIQSIIELEGKELGFDKLIATPEFMKPLAKAGKVLGPLGLMPNVKLGSLTEDVAAAIQDLRKGRLFFKADRDGILQAAVGKIAFPDTHLLANTVSFLQVLMDIRPKSLPGEGFTGYFKSVFMKTTKTKSIPVSLDSLQMAISEVANEAIPVVDVNESKNPAVSQNSTEV